MRKAILALTLVLVAGAGVLVAESIAWLRHGTPTYYTKNIQSDIVPAKVMMEKGWIKYDPKKEYYYQQTIEISVSRGTFPFLKKDTTVTEAKSLWERNRQ